MRFVPGSRSNLTHINCVAVPGAGGAEDRSARPSDRRYAAGATVLEWARRADAARFSTLGTIERVVYGNYDAVPALAAAAAVTSTIRLTTAILISPYRGNGALLAKQLAGGP